MRRLWARAWASVKAKVDAKVGARSNGSAHIGVILLTAFTSILLFQNCSAPVEPHDINSTSEADKLDFAYDGKINQIAYMTCSTLTGSTFDRSAYFTFRAGAYDNKEALSLSYDNGGLRLTDDFFAAVGRRRPDKQMTLLSTSKANTATVMQLAVRSAGDYQRLMTTTGAARANEDFQNMLEALGTTGISQILVDLPQNSRISYVRNGTVVGARMEASLNFGSSADTLASIRNGMSMNETLLAMTYTERAGGATHEASARSPSHVFEDSAASPTRDVYGRGYTLGFEMVGAGSLSGGHYQTAVLNTVSEKDLHLPNDSQGNWACPGELRLKIIRNGDEAETGCRKLPDPQVYNMLNHEHRLLKIARNSLRHEDWYIDIANKCIISKKLSSRGCYGTFTYVQYNPSVKCNQSPVSNTNLDLNKVCASYASICYRTN